MKEQILSKNYLIWGFLKKVNNNYLKDICLQNYNNRMSKNIVESRSEDIVLPDKDPEIMDIVSKLNKLFYKKYKENLRLTNYWAQVHFKGECTMPHDHLDVDDLFFKNPNTPNMSGVYYVDAPKNSGDLIFEYWVSQYHQERWRVSPETGKFLLFPSGLKHRVLKNLTNDARICISFNFRKHIERSKDEVE